MSRVGISPTRTKIGSYSPPVLSVAVLVNMPNLTADGTRKLTALHTCLKSVRAGSVDEVDVLAFDNGSVWEARSLLIRHQCEGTIQYLFQTHQQRDLNQCARMLTAACPGAMVLICDGSAAFRHGWREKVLAAAREHPDRLMSFRPQTQQKNGLASSDDGERFTPSSSVFAFPGVEQPSGSSEVFPGLSHGSLWLVPRRILDQWMDTICEGDRENDPQEEWDRILSDTVEVDSDWVNPIMPSEAWSREFIRAQGGDHPHPVRQQNAKPQVRSNGEDLSFSLLEGVYDGLFWFFSDARKERLEIDPS